MKYWLTLFFLVIFATFTMFAQTDSLSSGLKGKWEIVYSGGLTLPFLPDVFKDSYKNGYNIGFGIGYSFPPGEIGYSAVYGSFQLNNLSFDEPSFKNARKLTKSHYTFPNAQAQIFTAMVDFKGTFSSDKKSIAPYFLIGIGYSSFFSNPIEVTGDATLTANGLDEAAFVWQVGAGIEVPASDNITLFVDGRHILGVTKDRSTQYVPISLGFRISL